METKSGPERGAWSRRPSYTQRMVLTAELLNAGLDDELTRQRLLNRAVHGFGVVLGFGVAVDGDGKLDLKRGCLHLSEGLALDRHGRMLLWHGGRVGMADLVGPAPSHAGSYTLCAHFSARPPIVDDCRPWSGDRASHWFQEGVVFSLQRGCRDVDQECHSHPDGACLDHGQYVGQRTGGLLVAAGAGVEASHDVEWFLRAPGEPRPTGDDGWTYDADTQACVPLACVQICDLEQHPANAPVRTGTPQDSGPGSDAQGGSMPQAQAQAQARSGTDSRPPQRQDCEPRFGFCPGSEVVVSGIRPMVYRNPLLHELVRCCDVDTARVESVSWQAWIDRGWRAPVPWGEFASRTNPSSGGFEVVFTKRVDPRSLDESAIFMTAWYQDDDASWRSYRVPLESVEPLERDERVRGARLVPDEEWLNSEVRGRRSNLFGGSRFEVTIRGQVVRDACGRMLDARPIGLDCGVRCQARPGADLVSAFQVAPHPRYGSSARGHDGSAESNETSGDSPDDAGGSQQEGP